MFQLITNWFTYFIPNYDLSLAAGSYVNIATMFVEGKTCLQTD